MLNQIKVPAEIWGQFIKERAEANAAGKRADKLKEIMDLPKAGETTVGEYVIVDGNNNAIGKYTIAPRAGFTVQDSFSGRLS